MGSTIFELAHNVMTSPWQRMAPDAPRLTPERIATIAVQQVMAVENNGIPNHPWLPMVIYSGVFDASVDIDHIKALYEHNRWFRVWDYTVFDYHHFHPTAHEVLSVAKGSATLRLGGEDGGLYPVNVGDVLILPAGFGHKRECSSDDFTVVGGYPEGQENRSIVRADSAAAVAERPAIAATPLPASDPLYGNDSPLLSIWRAAADAH